MSNSELKVRITGDLTAIRNSLAALQGDIVKLDQRMSKVGQNGGGLGKLEGMLGRAGAAIRGLVGAYAGLQGVTAFARLSDQAAMLDARLRLATKSQQELNAATDQTFAIAQRTRTSLEAVVGLYARIERSTRDLGVNQATILALTEAIGQAALIGGGGPGSEAAIFQLTQGLASGQLRGEELNSVLEQTPRLAQAVADGLDIPIGKLREYAKEGKLTTEAVLRALLNQRDVLAQEAAQLPLTFSGAMTKIENILVRAVGKFNKDTGLADGLVKSFELVGVAIEKIGVAARVWTNVLVPGMQEVGAGISTLLGKFDELAGSTDETKIGFSEVIDEILILPQSLRTAFTIMIGEADKLRARLAFYFTLVFAGADKAWAAIQYSFNTMTNKLKELFAGAVDTILKGLATVSEKAADAAAAVGKKDVADQLRAAANGFREIAVGADDARRAQEENAAAYQRTQGAIADAVDAAAADMDRSISGANYAIAESLREREDALKSLSGAAEEAAAADGNIVIPKGGGTGEDENGALKKFYDQNIDLLQDATQRAIKELDYLYQEGIISAQAYYDSKTILEEQAIDLAIRQARGQLSVAKTQQDQERLLVEIIKLETDRAEVGIRNARDLAKANDETTRSYALLKAELAEQQGQFGAVEAERLKQERDRMLREFANVDGGQELVNKVFDVKLAEARADAIAAEARRINDELRDEADTLANEVEVGITSQSDAEDKLQQKRAETIRQLEELRRKTIEAYGEKPPPEVVEALRQIDIEIGKVKQSQNELGNAARNGAQQALEGFFMDLATGAKSFKEAFRDMVLSFIQGLARMAAEALAQRIILSIIGGFGGNPAVKTGGNIKHSGGMAGMGMVRMVNPLVFAGAPRFHSGGMVDMGLKAGEVPAILQTGERVLNREETKRYNAGDRPAPGTRVVNVLDPTLVTDQMDSAEGERVILNVIGRNPGRIKQILA